MNNNKIGKKERLKFITWNIGEDERNNDGKLNLESYDFIVNTIINEKIDIICLQEAIIKSDYLPSIASFVCKNTDLKNIIEFELSDSHINIGSKMGVVICSRYSITNYEMFMLDNPNLIYNVDEKTTYYSHNKGFIIADINGIKIITGHCLPFHVFKKSPLDYLDIFKKADNRFYNIYNDNKKIILCGDFNYDKTNEIFPKIMNNCVDLINESTRKDKQLDHFIISNNIICAYSNVVSNRFDHKFIECEILYKNS